MPRTATAIALVTLSLASTALGAGTLRGRVELREKKGRKSPDASETVVWIEGVRARAASPNQALRASIRMKDKEFVPHLLVVPTGVTVDFPNDDVIFHNVFSVSGPNRFDLDLYKKPKSGHKTFDQPGIVRVYCNIHPQMSAVIVVRDNPFYARARPDGAFTLEDVPAGRYTLRAWHERASEAASIPIEVPEQGEVQVTLQLDATKYRRAPHKNKYGEDYSSGSRY